jgi:hypothetical protein
MISHVSGEIRPRIAAAWAKPMRKLGFRTTDDMREFLEGETALATAHYRNDESEMLLIATDRRVVTIHEGHTYHRVYREIPYDRITAPTAFTRRPYRVYYTIEMYIDGRRLRFSRTSKSEAEAFVAVVRERVEAVRHNHPKQR